VLTLEETEQRYGTILVEACMTWKNADKEIQDRITEVENCWNRTRLQVDLLVRIQATLDSEHRRITNQNLGQLAERLSRAVSTIEGVLKRESSPRPGFLAFPTKSKRTKYVLAKSSLDGIISDLENWQRRFDPSWFLIMKIASDVIDRELERANPPSRPTLPSSSLIAAPTRESPITLASGLRTAVRHGRSHQSVFLSQEQLECITIPFSGVKAGRRRKAADTKWLIIDSIVSRPGANLQVLERDVRQLATKLSQADPFTFGLLNCKGVMRTAHGSQRGISSFDLIFRCPGRPEELRSLRQVLLGLNKRLSLSRKLGIAKELAKSVSYVHTFNFVHKNIRPESILLFGDTDSIRSSTFLIGFDSFRSADGDTSLIGDLAWDRNSYRHPLRQGEHPEEDYRMQHDIYSLGVCLLEIGLWESFVEYTDSTNPQPRKGESFSKFEAWLKESDSSPETQKSPRSPSCLDSVAFKLKDYFVERARVELPPRVGDKYAHVVVACLTCLDEDNEQFGDPADMMDENGMLVAVRFIEKILLQLEDISI